MNQMKNFLKSMLLGLVVLSMISGVNTSALGQEKYPSKQVVIIVPFTVGGGTDAWARTFAAAMSAKKYLGVDIAVSNLPGGQDLRGIGELYKADPDGYTLCAFNPPSSPFAWYMHKPNWDIRNLTGITVYGLDPQILVARAGYEFKDLKSLMAGLKAGKDPKVGLSGLGGMEHVSALLFSKRFNVPLKRFIPYNSTSDVMSALVRNEVDIAFSSFTAAEAFITEGKLVGIALAGQTQRSTVIPDVPTFSEFGDPLLELTFSRSIYAPPKLSKDRQQFLEKKFIDAQKNDILLQARFKSYNMTPTLGTGKDAEDQLHNAIKVAQDLEIEKLIKKK